MVFTAYASQLTAPLIAQSPAASGGLNGMEPLDLAEGDPGRETASTAEFRPSA